MKKIYTLLSAFFLFVLPLFAQAPGSFDPAFGNGGRVVPNLGHMDEGARCVLALPDGGILIGGQTRYYQTSNLALIKRLPDGLPDNSFGNQEDDVIRNPGVSHYDFYSLEMNDIAVLSNNRILCLGTRYEDGPNGPYAAEAWPLFFEANGQLTFNVDAKGFPIGGEQYGWAVQSLPDGHYYMVATDAVSHRLYLGRFTDNGNHDNSFGTAGIVSYPISGDWLKQGAAIAATADGKLLATVASGDAENGTILVYRLLSSGQPEMSFGSSGKMSIALPQQISIPKSIHQLPDGKILLTGYTQTNPAASDWDLLLVRLLPNGMPDPDFGNQGHCIQALSPAADYLQKSVVTADGKIVVCGNRLSGPDSHGFASRFLPDGQLDSAFATGGVHWMAQTSNARCYGLALLPDGSAVLAGQSTNPLTGEDVLFEYLDPSGQPKSNMDQNGIVNMPFEGGHSTLNAAYCLPDGKLLMAGSARSKESFELCVSRWLPDGSVDPAFGMRGKGVAGFGPAWTCEASAMGQSPDGKIVAAGEADSLIGGNNKIRKLIIARFLPGGQPDSSFNGTGKLLSYWGLQYAYVQSLDIEPDGKITVFGCADLKFRLARFLPNGQPDTTYGVGGLLQWQPSSSSFSFPGSMLRLPDGGLLVSGEFVVDGGYKPYLAKLTPDGALDEHFGSEGDTTYTTLPAPEFFDGDIGPMALQPDGKVVLGGSLSGEGSNSSQTAYMAAFRIWPNGEIDTLFGHQGWSWTKEGKDWNGPTANTLLVQPDGKILLAGWMDAGSSIWSPLIGRINADGSADSTFADNGFYLDTTSWLFAEAKSLCLQPDGKIVVAGPQSDDYGGASSSWIYRLISGLAVGVIDRPQRLSQALIYPNPIRQSGITVEYELLTASAVHIELLDIQGKMAGTLLQAERPAGAQKESLHLPPGLVPGIYLLNVRTALGNSVVKVDIRNP